MKRASLLLAAALSFTPGMAGAASVDCGKLRDLKLAPIDIGLPTGGAMITNAADVAAAADGSPPAHCLVSGEIRSIDPAAPPIHFQIALPAAWNGKALMFGGGGFNGVIPNVTGNPLNALPNTITPLARGYAVFGSDSGHVIEQKPARFSIGREDGKFFSNAEAYRNYIGDALKKTHDVSLRVIAAAYGRGPSRAYFLGGSKGGGEALTVAGRWPKDWDGVVALYPARDFTVSMLGALTTTRALAAPGAYLDLSARGLLYRAALATCDGLDGVKDGVISNVRACHTAFDPATASLDGKPLRCRDGGAGADCLSDVQIGAIRKVGAPTAFGFVVNGKRPSFPGYNIMTSDLGNSSSSPLKALLPALTIGDVAPATPPTESSSMSARFSDNFVRYAITGDTTYDQLQLDPAQPGRFAARMAELSAIDQAADDLSGFAARNGKLLIMHGTDDMLVSPRMTELYYKELHAKMGQKKLDSFLRYYEVPGFGHAFSTVFNAGWDQLSAIEGWVEKGIDPATNQTVTDTVGVPGRTRPMCLYPTWPRYNGSGDVNLASSFHCSAR